MLFSIINILMNVLCEPVSLSLLNDVIHDTHETKASFNNYLIVNENRKN